MTDVGDAVRGPWTWRLRGLLTVLCVAQALEVLGVTVVIVALPAIGIDLGLATAELQLVVTVYAVLYGGLLLTAGRVCDLLDRRRVFAAGLGLTLVGAACCALAPTGATLLVGRAVHGLGGAVVTPAALSLLTSTFREGPKRSVAVRAWTAAAAGGGAAGLVVGGLVVDATGWRGVFWLLTPVAALARWSAPGGCCRPLLPRRPPGRSTSPGR